MEADNLAYLLLKAKRLMILQSLCDFNVWWMSDISPVIMTDETIAFLTNNKNKFKRKISIHEFLLFDAIIKHKKPSSFNEFQEFVLSQKFYDHRNKSGS
jgi:hypothetical protein